MYINHKECLHHPKKVHKEEKWGYTIHTSLKLRYRRLRLLIHKCVVLMIAHNCSSYLPKKGTYTIRYSYCVTLLAIRNLSHPCSRDDHSETFEIPFQSRWSSIIIIVCCCLRIFLTMTQ